MTKKSRYRLMIFAFLLTTGGTLAQAEDIGVAESTENSHKPERVIRVKVVTDRKQEKRLKEIQWNDTLGKVVTRYFGSSSESILSLGGRIERENSSKWHVIWNQKSFGIGSDGKFHVDLPYDSGFQGLELVLVGPKGEVEYHFYKLNLDLPDSSRAGGKVAASGDTSSLEFNKKLKQRFFVSPGLGISTLTYQQTDVDPYHSIVMTAKMSMNYLLAPPKWDIGFTGFLNFVSLTRSSEIDARFIGLNLRLGHIFPQIKAPWRLSLYGGWYYSSMMASDRSFGYRNVSGPQLFPTLRRTLNNGHALSTYLKFSPISNRLDILKFSNHEIATGLAYLIPVGKNTYSVSLDFSKLAVFDEDVGVRATSFSLGGGMTF